MRNELHAKDSMMNQMTMEMVAVQQQIAMSESNQNLEVLTVRRQAHQQEQIMENAMSSARTEALNYQEQCHQRIKEKSSMALAESNTAAENERLRQALDVMKHADQSPSAVHQQQITSLGVQIQVKDTMITSKSIFSTCSTDFTASQDSSTKI